MIKIGLLAGLTTISLALPLGAYYPASATSGFPGEVLLTLGGGPRGMATGGAFSTVDKSNAAPYWNPAGLAGLNAHELSFFYAPMWMDGEYGIFNYAHPLPPGFALTQNTTLGLSYYRLKSGEAEKTDVLARSVGHFSDKWDVLNLTYARKLSQNINWGMNYKLLNRKYLNYSVRLYGLDTGLQGKLKLPNRDTLKFGFTVQNFMFNELQNRSGEKISPNLKFGLGYRTREDRILLLLDMDQVIDDKPHDPRFYFGGEVNILSLLSLRAGLNYKQIAVGLGIHLFNMDIDYAYIFHDLGNTHRLGLNLRFGKRHDRETAFIRESRNKVSARAEILKNTAEVYNDLITKSIELFSQGDYELSREEFVNLSRQDPLNKETKKNIEQIINEIDEIVSGKKTEQAEEHLQKAKKLFRENRFDRADEEFEKALLLNPDLEQARVLRLRNTGFQNIAGGDLEKGAEYLEKALQIDPEHEGIRKNLEKLREYLE